MSKWKLQNVEPDTCDSPGCRYIELWDVEANPLIRENTIVAFDRMCTGHQTNVPLDKILWADGNWKPKKEYIDYQRKWFRRLNHVQWLIDNPDEPMPKQIRRLTSDPITTGSVDAPSQIEIDGMNIAYAWNRADNQRKNTTLSLIEIEIGTRDEINWSFTGTGNTRNLIVAHKELNNTQINRVLSVLNIQFGTDKIIVKNT